VRVPKDNGHQPYVVVGGLKILAISSHDVSKTFCFGK
jgi:hypothetical protein